jgi:hypothetical protein
VREQSPIRRMRKWLILIVAVMVVLTAFAIYWFSRPSPTETYSLHFVDAISGTPLTNVSLSIGIGVSVPSFKLRGFLSKFGLSWLPEENGETFKSNGVQMLRVNTGSGRVLFISISAPRHISTYISYEDDGWHGTNISFAGGSTSSVRFTGAVTNHILDLRLYPERSIE